MSKSMQNFYDTEYHNDFTKTALLSDYSLKARLDFFQEKCISENDKVLDYGCGTGAILTGLSGINKYESYGVDVSENAIDYAKSQFKDYNWLKISIDDKLPFNDGNFDVVLSSEVIEHVFDVDSYLKELHRVLKPGGILGITCPFHGLTKDLLIILSGKFESHFHNPYEPHIRFYSIKGMSNVLTKNSFELIETKGICPYFNFRPLSRMMAFKAKSIG